jgi:5,10-methylenetetrahydromethanopterin reductase
VGVRIGQMISSMGSLDVFLASVRSAAEHGYTMAWTPQIWGADPLTALAVAGREVPNIGLGTAVLPSYPRHPNILAAQVLTVQALTSGRLTLGIGTSHKMLVEGFWGYSFERPARHMREYLEALWPLLRGEAVNYQGETLKAMLPFPLDIPNAPAPPVLLAALAPAMLKLAGTLADGTITWQTGIRTLGEYIVPSITAAAEAAGRPRPRVVAGLTFCVTADEATARERMARESAVYRDIPSYRAMLDREGVDGPADIAIIGDEEVVAAAMRQIADAGASEILASVFGTDEEQARTAALLPKLAATM